MEAFRRLLEDLQIDLLRLLRYITTITAICETILGANIIHNVIDSILIHGMEVTACAVRQAMLFAARP